MALGPVRTRVWLSGFESERGRRSGPEGRREGGGRRCRRVRPEADRRTVRLDRQTYRGPAYHATPVPPNGLGRKNPQCFPTAPEPRRGGSTIARGDGPAAGRDEPRVISETWNEPRRGVRADGEVAPLALPPFQGSTFAPPVYPGFVRACRPAITPGYGAAAPFGGSGRPPKHAADRPNFGHSGSVTCCSFVGHSSTIGPW